MNKFSKKSLTKLNSCHIDLRRILKMAITYSQVDFGIAEGTRTIKKQQEYFKAGKSKIDGITKLSKHNHNPSLAADIYCYIDGKASWDKYNLMYLTGVIDTCAKLLLEQGLITHKIRFGSNWDCDGEFVTDEKFRDLPHIELI